MNTVMNTGTRTSAVLLATAALVATGTGIAFADTPAPTTAAQVATPPLGATNNSAVVYFLEQQPDGSLAPAFQEPMSFDMLGNYDATYTDDGAGLVGTVTGNEYLTVTDPAAR